jgi:hypothetical protein
MKWPLSFILIGAIFGSIKIVAATSQVAVPDSKTGTPPATEYAIVQQDGNSRVWSGTNYETTPDGQTIPHVHQYTELATGLNYLVNEQWVESSEAISILPDGTAAATNGQHQVYFPADIYNGVIETVTPDGLHLKSRPLALSYDDGTNTALIATLTNSVGQLLGTNQMIYANAFSGIAADLVYTYTKAGFEQDVVLREQPPTPASLGFDPSTTRLQLLTEFFNSAQPSATSSNWNQQAGLTDTTLAFGKMKMIRGKAFATGETTGTNRRHSGQPVYKSWQHLQTRTFLVEQLPVAQLAAELEQLPTPVNITLSSPAASKHNLSATYLLPPPRLAPTSKQTMRLAKADLNLKPGLVLDYNEINSDQTDLTCYSGQTYYISGAVNLSGRFGSTGNPDVSG